MSTDNGVAASADAPLFVLEGPKFHQGATHDGLAEQYEAPGEVSRVLGGTQLFGAEQPQPGEADRSEERFQVEWDPERYEVSIDSDMTLEDYRQRTRTEDWGLIENWAEGLRDKKVVFLNPTMEGGGVAMLRPPLVHLMRKLGVDAHWFVMAPIQDTSKGNPFTVTKKMHNISQRRTAPDVHLTEEDKTLHRTWAAENAEVLERQPEILEADLLVCDDPQPAPAIARLRAANPTMKVVWRNHIDTDGQLMADSQTPQGEIASYIFDECGLNTADAVVTHPVEQFVHPDFSDKTYFAPATTDPFDDLNRFLEEAEVRVGMEFINEQIKERNAQFKREGRLEDVQPEINPNRPLITLVARFDESKGMDHAMNMGAQVRQQMRQRLLSEGVSPNEVEARLPQIVIVGNGSVDDPSGVPMYNKMLQIRREQHADEADGITIMRLKHNYTAINALMRSSKIAMQTSEAEGCETRISDWIEHGVPAVVFDVGGMPEQVIDGQSGYILRYNTPGHDLTRGALLMTELLSNAELYAQMADTTRAAAEEFNSRDYTTVANLGRWLRVFNNVLTEPQPRADRLWRMGDFVAMRRAADAAHVAVTTSAELELEGAV